MATRETDESKTTRRRSPQRAANPPTVLPARGEISNNARYLMIQKAAYLRAERRGFAPGFELDDWLAAENEIDALLGAAPTSPTSQ